MHTTVTVNTYLIFVIFFTRTKFLSKKIYTEKRVNYDKWIDKIAFYWDKQRKIKLSVKCHLVCVDHTPLCNIKVCIVSSRTCCVDYTHCTRHWCVAIGKSAEKTKTKSIIDVYVCVAEKCEMMDFYLGFFLQ